MQAFWRRSSLRSRSGSQMERSLRTPWRFMTRTTTARSMRMSSSRLRLITSMGSSMESLAYRVWLLYSPATSAVTTRAWTSACDTYDEDDSGVIEMPEAIQAIDDYLFNDLISKATMLAVLNCYYSGTHGKSRSAGSPTLYKRAAATSSPSQRPTCSRPTTTPSKFRRTTAASGLTTAVPFRRETLRSR